MSPAGRPGAGAYDPQRPVDADAVMQAARDAGRHPPTRGLWDHHAADIQDAIRAVISRAHGTDGLP
mgnify:CR=1 FL=1